MKKTKNLLLLAVLFLGIFLATGKANAYGMAWTLKNASLVCDPVTLSPGETAKCYYFGTADSTFGEGVSTSNTGFYMYMYTTKNLNIEDVEANTKLTDADAVYVKSSGSTKKISTTSEMPTGLASFTCDMASETTGSENMHDSGCGVFYTKTGKTAQFVPSKMTVYGSLDATSSLVVSQIGNNTPVVLGSITVSLPDDNSIEGCGDICISAYGVATENDWASADCSSDSGSSAWSSDKKCDSVDYISSKVTAGGNASMQKGNFYCYELTLKATVPQNVESGAFISYTILAAGALIAICAVTIAKKNNKLQKI